MMMVIYSCIKLLIKVFFYHADHLLEILSCSSFLIINVTILTKLWNPLSLPFILITCNDDEFIKSITSILNFNFLPFANLLGITPDINPNSSSMSTLEIEPSIFFNSN